MSKFAEFVYDTDFKDLYNKSLTMMPWLPHTLLTYLQKYFQACTPSVTKHKNLRGIMAQDPIDPRTYKETESFLTRLMDILRSCVIGYNMVISSYPLEHTPSSSPPPPPRVYLKIHPRRRQPRSQRSPRLWMLSIHLHGPRATSSTPALTRSSPLTQGQQWTRVTII